MLLRFHVFHVFMLHLTCTFQLLDKAVVTGGVVPSLPRHPRAFIFIAQEGSALPTLVDLHRNFPSSRSNYKRPTRLLVD